MAEAAVHPSAARFFCHRCVQEVNPVLPDYLCSRCHSGFIEELTQSSQENTRLHDETAAPEEENPFNQISDVFNFINTMRRTGRNESTDQARENYQDNWARPGPSSSRNRQEEGPGRRQSQDSEYNRMPRGEGFLFNLLQSLTENTGFIPGGTNFPVFVNLHGNPGDYAWGHVGWNAIISQLINQLDGTGPPPLPKEKIDEIPTIGITQEQVDKNLQCTVCMEDYIVDEPVRLLSCQHHFHNDCIIPWLQLHGTCPICRKLLTDDSGRNLYDTPYSQGGVSQESDSESQRTNTQSNSNDSSNSYRARSPHNPSTYDFDDDCD